MRDPVTKLAIVDGGSIDPELCKMFADVFMVPEKLAVVYYLSPIVKKSRYGMFNDKRVLLVTDQCLYICKEDGTRRRCIRIRDVSEVLCFTDCFVALKIPTEYDMVFKLANTSELEYFLNILRVVQELLYGRALVVVGHAGTYKQHAGIVLDRPDNFVPQTVPFTFITAADAVHGALDELLRPPPPPHPNRPNEQGNLAVPSLSSEGALVLQHPLLDPNSLAPVPIHLRASLNAIRGGGGATQGPRAPSPPVEGFSDGLRRLAAVQQTLEETQAVVAEEQRRKRRSEELSRATALPPQVGPITNAATAKGDDDHPHHGASSPRWSLASKPRAFADSATSPPKAQHPLPVTPDMEPDDNTLTAREALHRRREAALESENMVLKAELEASRARADQEAIVRRLRESAQMRPAMETSAVDVSVIAATLPSYSVLCADGKPADATEQRGGRDAAPPSTRQSVVEFEATIASKPLHDRLVLRQFQIDQKRAEIHKAFSDTEPYDPIRVAALQEDLMALVRKLEADIAEIDAERPPVKPSREEAAPQAATNAEVAPPQWSNPTQSAVGPVGANSAGPTWEWTPERTAEYWAWVAAVYGPQAVYAPTYHERGNGGLASSSSGGNIPRRPREQPHDMDYRHRAAHPADDVGQRASRSTTPKGHRRVQTGYTAATESSRRHTAHRY
jgi:hypothetical protein